MEVLDLDLLLYALDETSPRHDAASSSLEAGFVPGRPAAGP